MLNENMGINQGDQGKGQFQDGSAGRPVNLIQIVVFKVGTEKYGIYIEEVQEIIRLPEITKLPHAPDFIKGVINLRGQIIPVIDMRTRLNIEKQEYTRITRVIVVKIRGKFLGMIVDSVSQVILINEAEIEPPPDIIHGLAKKYILGIGRYDQSMIIILNVERVLTDEEFEKMSEAVKKNGN